MELDTMWQYFFPTSDFPSNVHKKNKGKDFPRRAIFSGFRMNAELRIPNERATRRGKKN